MEFTRLEKEVIIEVKKIYLNWYQSSVSKYTATIVLLHDSLGCVELWRDWPSILCSKLSYNVLVYDRVGYGKSTPYCTSERSVDYLKEEAFFLEEIRAALSLEELIVFGHSDGGSIALWYGSLFPDFTKAVICEAGYIFVEDITLKGIEEERVLYATTDLEARLSRYHGERVDTLVNAWFSIWMSKAFCAWSMEKDLTTLMTLLLFIQGENDEYGTLAQVEQTLAM